LKYLKKLFILVIFISILSCKSTDEKFNDALANKDYRKIKEIAQIDRNNEYTEFTETLLYRSYINRDLVAFKILLDNDANPDIAVNQNDNLLKLTFEEGEYDYVELLLKNGANPNIVVKKGSDYNYIPFFIITEKMNGLLPLIADNIDYSYIYEGGNTILHLSAKYSNPKDFKAILDKYDDVNIVNERNESPFLNACRTSNVENMFILVENGADISQFSKYNYPWGIAIQNIYSKNDFRVANFLIEYGPALDEVVSHVGSSPLSHACELKNYEIAEYLLKNGASPYILDKRGYMPMSHFGGPHDYSQEEYDTFKTLFDKYDKENY